MASVVEWVGTAMSTATLGLVIWFQRRGEQLDRERNAADHRRADDRLRTAEAKARADRERAHDAVIEQYAELGDRVLELTHVSMGEVATGRQDQSVRCPPSMAGVYHLEMLADVLGEAPGAAAETKLLIGQLKAAIASPYGDQVATLQAWRDELNRKSLRLRRIVGLLRTRKISAGKGEGDVDAI